MQVSVRHALLVAIEAGGGGEVAMELAVRAHAPAEPLEHPLQVLLRNVPLAIRIKLLERAQ